MVWYESPYRWYKQSVDVEPRSPLGAHGVPWTRSHPRNARDRAARGLRDDPASSVDLVAPSARPLATQVRAITERTASGLANAANLACQRQRKRHAY